MNSLPDWARFFAREDWRRRRYSAFIPAEPTIDLQHGDLECRFTYPVDDGVSSGYLDAPWRLANARTKPARYEVLTTDLKEHEIVAGSLAKARRALDLAVAAAEPGQAIAFNSACVSDMIGEDCGALARACPRSARVRWRPSDGGDIAATAAREALDGHPRPVGRDAGSVALLGFFQGRALGELRELLSVAGASADACVIPCLSRACVLRAMRAQRLIAVRGGIHDDSVRAFEAACGREAARPNAPYGWAGTESWLRSALDGALDAVRERAIAGIFERALRRAEGLRRRARRHCLGFVVEHGGEACLDDPAQNAGVPLASVIREFGFSIEIIPGPFADPDELEARLKAAKCQAVYSDYRFDARLSRAGKARFSLAMFEPGIAGASRTCERLLRVCRMDFYRLYAGFLS